MKLGQTGGHDLMFCWAASPRVYRINPKWYVGILSGSLLAPKVLIKCAQRFPSQSQCDKVARIYTSLLVYTSIWGKILVFYSYFCDLLVFLWFRAHFTHCELFEPVKSYGNDSAILKQSKNMLLNFELHRSTMNLHQKNVLTYALLS